MSEYRFLPPQKLGEVFTRVKATLPDAFRDPNAFAQVYWAKNSAFFELGDFEGALWLVNIAIGWKATLHLVLWGERLKHHIEASRGIAHELINLFQLCKLEAYIPLANKAACSFATKVGWEQEGVLYQWDRYDGQLVDIGVYSLWKEN